MQRFELGGFEVVSLTDGSFALAPAKLYPNTEPDMLDRLADHLDQDGVYQMPCLCFAIRTPDRTVLVDAGLGPGSGGTLLEELDAAGVDPETVDTVVITHPHSDHVGWLAADGDPFARARVLVSRADWEHPPGGALPEALASRAAEGRLDVADDDHALDPTMRLLRYAGHTPGHQVLELAAGGVVVAFIGDLLLSPLDVEIDGLRNIYDDAHETAAASRGELLDQAERQELVLAASHLPAPGLGRVVREAGVRRWLGM